jgi:hypothetical protein
MSGMVELGSVFWGISQGYSVVKIIGIAMAYQMGNILRFAVTPKIAKFESILAGFVLLLSIGTPFLPADSIIKYIATLVMFMFFSTVLQNVRSSVQGNIPRWQKRSSRVIGFVLSAIVYVANIQSMIVLSLLLLFFSLKTANYSYDNWLSNWRKGAYGERVCWAMVTHQAHYFAYNYILLIIVMAAFNNSLIATICFALNWIPYTITEPLIQKLRWRKWKELSILAHVFNAVVLLAMYYMVSKNIYYTVALWVLTGFGGGNVFCIKKALSDTVKYDKNVWSFSEQIGHVLGVCTALIISFVCNEMRVSMFVATLYALLTIPTIMYTMKRKRI